MPAGTKHVSQIPLWHCSGGIVQLKQQGGWLSLQGGHPECPPDQQCTPTSIQRPPTRGGSSFQCSVSDEEGRQVPLRRPAVASIWSNSQPTCPLRLHHPLADSWQ